MHRRSLSLITLLLVVCAFPLSASQFVEQPFDRVARESSFIVRATVDQTWSAWDDAHEVIYTYATLRVNRYFGETAGPDTLVVREVGGTVDGYRMEAVGFPEIREGEDVVLFLSRWEDGADYRIHAFNQGKFLVRNRGAIDVLMPDSVQQGHARLERRSGPGIVENLMESPFTLEEFAEMVDSARAGREVVIEKRR